MITRLRTRHPVLVRPVGPGDRAALTDFYASLSPDSRYARFLGAGAGISTSIAESFCGIDHRHREGLVAVSRARDADLGRPERIVGHLCLEPLDDGSFEMAIAVADAWRRRGVGRALLTESIAWARRHGATRMRATMLACNSAVLALIHAVAPTARLTMADAGTVEATFDIDAEVDAAA